MEEIIKAGGLVLSGGALSLIVTSLVKVWTSRNQKNDVGPQPFEVKAVDRYVTCEDCIRKHMAIDKRHDELNQEIKNDRQALSDQLTGIRSALSANDKAAEERSRNLHKRIDPMIESVGVLKGRVEDHIHASTNR